MSDRLAAEISRALPIAGDVRGKRCGWALASYGDESSENQQTTHADLGKESRFI